jgi:hypothetical protein
MAAEERDVPTLEELLTEIDATIARLDQPGAAAANAMDEIRNTILPLMKDVVASVGLGFIDIQDEINPIRLGGADAEEIHTLLQAFAASRPTDTQLQERVKQAADLLEQDDDEEGGDEDDEETN